MPARRMGCRMPRRVVSGVVIGPGFGDGMAGGGGGEDEKVVRVSGV